MKKLLTTIAVLTAVATPALAHGYAAHRGEARNFYESPYGAYGPDGSYNYVAPRHGTPGPIARNEEIRLDHAKGDIGQ
jgi:hypothetical protein